MATIRESKPCRRCGVVKPLHEFPVKKRLRDGHEGTCRACRRDSERLNHRRWVQLNREKALAIRRQNYARNRATRYAGAQAWKAANIERVRMMMRAVQLVYSAVKSGRLVRPAICSRCNMAGAIEAAHHDYSLPLDVIWLCRPCHRRWDSHQPKTK